MKKFKRIFIEISNVCNLKCTFCPPSDRGATTMSTADFEVILKKLEGYGDHIYLHVKGEPLFHPQFEEILDLCHRHHKRVNITTNGTLLGHHGPAILANPAVRLVNISLQSFESQTINQGSGKESDQEGFLTYLTGVLDFVKRGLDTTKMMFDLRLWDFDDASLEIGGQKQKTLDFIECYLNLPLPIYVTTTHSKGGKLTSNVYISKGYEFEWPSLKAPPAGNRWQVFGHVSANCRIVGRRSGALLPRCRGGHGAG